MIAIEGYTELGLWTFSDAGQVNQRVLAYLLSFPARVAWKVWRCYIYVFTCSYIALVA